MGDAGFEGLVEGVCAAVVDGQDDGAGEEEGEGVGGEPGGYFYSGEEGGREYGGESGC